MQQANLSRGYQSWKASTSKAFRDFTIFLHPRSSRARFTARVTLLSCPIPRRSAIQRFDTPVRSRITAAIAPFSSGQ